MMTPRLKYAAPAMAPEFTYRPTPVEQRPWIPPVRIVHTALAVVDLGYQPLLVEDRPTRVRADIEVSPRAENKAMLVPPEKVTPDRAAWPCVDCQQPFKQVHPRHVRCVACGVAHRRAADLARKTTDITRRRAVARNSGRRRVA